MRPSPPVEVPLTFPTIPARLAVVVGELKRLTYTGFYRYRSRPLRFDVQIGEATLDRLRVLMPKMFAQVTFVESADETGGHDFVLLPHVDFVIKASSASNAHVLVQHRFEFARAPRSETIEVIESHGSDLIRLSFLASQWASPGIPANPEHIAEAVDKAEGQAFEDLVRKLPESKVAAAARGLR
jgi:hypothetical protein